MPDLVNVTSSQVDIAVDIGQSGARSRIFPVDASGTQLADHPSRELSAATLPDIMRLTSRALEADHQTARRLAIGATGVWGDPSRFDPAAIFPMDITELVVADDGFTAHLGALEGHTGIVTAIGTGIVTVARSVAHEPVHIGGYGLLSDDRGSGAWIGQQALQHSIDHHERIRPASTIYDLCRATLGPQTEWAARITHDGAQALATLCHPLAELARSGDAQALAIFTAAGTHIGDRLRAAFMASGSPSSATVSLTGGVARAHDLLSSGITTATAGLPLTYQPPVGTPLDGAVLLLQRPELRTPSTLVHVVPGIQARPLK